MYQAPFRLQKMLLQLQSYDLKVRYKHGKEIYLANALSGPNLKETEVILISDLDVNMLWDMVAMSSEKYKEFQNATSQDPVLKHDQFFVLFRFLSDE